MSKASEWAATQASRPANLFIDGWSTAWVDVAATRPMCILSRTMYTPEQALELAKWINDSFGEQPTPEPAA